MTSLLHPEERQRDAARMKALEELARAHGLTFSADVDQSFMDPAFFLFGLGTDQVMGVAENVLDGDWRSFPVREFDYSVVGMEDVAQVAYTQTLHYSVVMIPIENAAFPYVRVQKKDLLKRLEDELEHVSHLHIDHEEVECGVKDFDHEFEVRSLHPDFVRALFDHDLMEAVLEAGRDFAYEVFDNGFIAYSPMLDPDDIPRLLDAAKAFHDHIPDAARKATGS